MNDLHHSAPAAPPLPPALTRILEAALFAAGEPLGIERLQSLFPPETRPNRKAVQLTLAQLAQDYAGRGIALVQLAGGWCFQTCEDLSPWVRRLWPESQPRYSRAFLETLAVIAWRQPVTRGDIEAIRGIPVGTGIMKSLLDHEWVRVVGERETPGRPQLYGTARRFLDHFNLQGLEDLPTPAPAALDTSGLEGCG